MPGGQACNNTDCALIAKMRANCKNTKPNNTSGSPVEPMGPRGPPLVEGHGLLGRAPPYRALEATALTE